MQNHANHTQTHTHTYKCKMQTTHTYTRARAHTHTPHECKIQTTHTHNTNAKCKPHTHTHTQHNTNVRLCFGSSKMELTLDASVVQRDCAARRKEQASDDFLFMQAWHHDSFFNLCVLQALIFSFFDLRLTNTTKILKTKWKAQDMGDVRVHLPRHIHANRSINRPAMFAFCQFDNAVSKFYM